MRLLCICDKPVINVFVIMPKYMEEVNGEQSSIHDDSYVILEYPIALDGRPQSIHKRHFIPLSDIDEVEMLEERVVVYDLVGEYTL